MAFELPTLPYPDDALAPHISAETISFHYGKHHRTYVDNLNKLTAGSDWESRPLEEVVCNASGAVFNNAAQAWNHSFYWSCLSPNGGGEPNGQLAEKIFGTFGDFESFREQFTKTAVGLFGSGWAWLVQWPKGGLEIVGTGNADTPIVDGATPLLTCDVWEHAYYIDYRNARPKYLEHFWHLIDWDSVARRLSG